jgi:quinol monooxygenase YgiN
MGINILTEFRVKPGRENDVIDLLRHLLPESKKHASNVIEEISIRQNQDDSTDIVSAQRWKSRQAYEDYFKWRTDDGYSAKFEEMLQRPLSIRFFDEVPMD